MRSQPLPEDLLAPHLPRIRLALALAAALVLSADRAEGVQPPAVPADRIEVVLDASADMRQPIGDVARIDLARQFLAALRSGLAPAPAPALRVYGGSSPRARRDCSDTRLLVEPGSPPGRWSEALAAIQPQGISPLGAALRQAAADSVTAYVLVTDGGDDCRADPCTVWKETIGGGPNRRSRLHVVGLDPQPASLEELRCLSRSGSGSLTVIDAPEEAAAAGQRLALVLRNEGLVEVRATLGLGGDRLPLPVRVVRPLRDEMVAAFAARAPRAVPAGVYRVVVESVPPLTFERVMVLPGETTTLEATALGRLRSEPHDVEPGAPVGTAADRLLPDGARIGPAIVAAVRHEDVRSYGVGGRQPQRGAERRDALRLDRRQRLAPAPGRGVPLE